MSGTAEVVILISIVEYLAQEFEVSSEWSTTQETVKASQETVKASQYFI